MRRLRTLVLGVGVLVGGVGCGTGIGSAPSTTQPSVSAATEASASPSPMAAVGTPASSSMISAAPGATNTEARMDVGVIERLVIDDLAATLGTTVKEIRHVATEARTWPDAGLGCQARKGVHEPAPIAGYLVQLAHGMRTFEYHTDQKGLFVRCLEPGKPLGPIQR